MYLLRSKRYKTFLCKLRKCQTNRNIHVKKTIDLNNRLILKKTLTLTSLVKRIQEPDCSMKLKQ